MAQKLHKSIYRQKKSIYVMKDSKEARSNSISEKKYVISTPVSHIWQNNISKSSERKTSTDDTSVYVKESLVKLCLRKLVCLVKNGAFKFSYLAYIIVFLILPAIAVEVMQSSLYEKGGVKQITKFVTQIWLKEQYIFLLNYGILVLLFLCIILLFNNFWIASIIYIIFFGVLGVANYFKVQFRSEPVIPSDFNFIGNAGEISSFIPADGYSLIFTVVWILLVSFIVCSLFWFLDSRRHFIRFQKKTLYKEYKEHVKKRDYKDLPSRLKAKVRTINPWLFAVRCVCWIAPFSVLFSFVWFVSESGSWASRLASACSNATVGFSELGDMQKNGYVVGFVRYVHVKAIDEPEGYSKAKMNEIADKYKDEASKINASRNNNLTDNTVIMVLSESFSDPTRVPGIQLASDPMPQIRSLKETCTSGLALSTGYGGGTANIEFQALTGLSMTNFNTSVIPYQQLIPSQKWTPSFNQLWNDANGDDSSQAFHSYNRTMYFRGTNYKKFGFSTFWTADGPNEISFSDTIDNSEYISDESIYQSVYEEVSQKDSGNQFIQVVTMQNHMPYYDWYDNNEFKDDDLSEYEDDYEKQDVETYAKGMQYTDASTIDFLNQLNELDKPITVIFYGDHLPGIYKHENGKTEDARVLRETDYFIWSNSASNNGEEKIQNGTAYTSSNYFMALAAEHMDAKVTPYLAFLTKMRNVIPAIAPAESEDNDSPMYLDVNGNRINKENLTKEMKDLLEEYKLIQYDITSGKNYLKQTDFMNLE
jgi:hypothetical protein